MPKLCATVDFLLPPCVFNIFLPNYLAKCQILCEVLKGLDETDGSCL